MRYSNNNGFSKRKKIWTTVITAVLVFGLTIPFVFLMQKLSSTTELIDAMYTEETGSPRLLTLQADYGSSEDDGKYLTGYTIKLINPSTKNVIDELTISRQPNDVPPLPVAWIQSLDNCWLIQKAQFIQGDTGFISHFGIVQDKIRVDNRMVLTGYIPGDFAGPNFVTLTNKYNEKSCLNLKDSRITNDECAFGGGGYEEIKTAFVLVNKTSTSTRYHMYYYETDKPDPMVMHQGNEPQSFLYYLWFSRNKMPQNEFDNYKLNLKPNEKIRNIYTANYLNSPTILYSDEKKVVFLEYDIEKKITTYYCYDNTGRKLWNYVESNTDSQPYQRKLSCRFSSNISVLILDTKIIGINWRSGKVEWEY